MATLNMHPHAIVDEKKFSTSFDYHGVMMPSLRLYSELLLCPQSLHYYYAIFYGKNQASATLPPAFKGKPLWETPQEFASNKGILDLTPRDRAAVFGELNRLSDDIKFTIKTFQDDSRAETTLDNNASRLSTGCTIAVSQSLYDDLADPKLTSPQRLMVQFYVAVVLLHETAHAATYIHMGSERGAEDFFEDSLIAEAGYEATSRIFGLEPYMPIPHPRSSNSSSNCTNTRASKLTGPRWQSWQTAELPPLYDLDKLCRNRDGLPTEIRELPIDEAFIAKLFTEDFWQTTVRKEGPLALVQKEVVDGLLAQPEQWDDVVLPQSLVDLCRERDGRGSYAARKYAHLRNDNEGREGALAWRTILEEGDGEGEGEHERVANRN